MQSQKIISQWVQVISPTFFFEFQIYKRILGENTDSQKTISTMNLRRRVDEEVEIGGWNRNISGRYFQNGRRYGGTVRMQVNLL